MKFKITTIISFALSLIISNLSHAQSFQWVKHQTHNIQFNPEMTSFNSAGDHLGNSYLSSIYNFKVIYSQDYYCDMSLKKFNSSGALLFNKILYGKLTIEYLQTDSFGNIYLAGNFMDTLMIDSVNFLYNTGSGFNLNNYMIKLSSEGDLIWKKNINVIYTTQYRMDGFNISDDNIYAGYLVSVVNGFLKKYDLDGNEILSIPNQHVRGISSIDTDEYGNIYAGGSCSNGDVTFGDLTVSTP